MKFKHILGQTTRFYCINKSPKPKICIVGSGPAGFYAAQYLAKRLDNCIIDMYERLPVPFGLVRFGVAPDHPEVKNVINTFTKTAENPRLNFIGNVNLGTDISLKLLQQCYHVVLLTYGAEQNKNLNIPGENKNNVLSARKIVGWYNGLPSDSNLKVDLKNVEKVAIFGQGNVAIDVARILLSPVDILKNTDITQYALNELGDSKIKSVQLIGRRGPLQAAFTIKELREMLKLPGCDTVWRKSDFTQDIYDNLSNLSRPKKRMTELMIKSLNEQKNIKNSCNKQFLPMFLRSPLEILENNKVVLGINDLHGDDIVNKQCRLTNERETIESDLIITSIGYKSIQADPALPFDKNKGITLNDKGKISKGLYSAGWVATGPVGVILTTMNNAFAIADGILKDIEKERLIDNEKNGFNGVKDVLKNDQLVNWDGWKKIDKYEVDEGKKLKKPREKVTDIKKMIEIANL